MIQYYETLKDWFVFYALAPERTKTLVFVFVLAHDQAIRPISKGKRQLAYLCGRLKLSLTASPVIV